MSYGSGAYGGSTAMTYACLGVMLGIGVIGFAMTASEEDSRRHEGQLAPGSEGSLLRGETTTAMPGPLASEPGTAATAATAAAAEAEEETECPIITNAEAEANPGAATTKSRCRLYQKAFETWVATLSGDVQSRVTSKWPDLGAAFKQLWAVKLPGGKRFFRSVCDKPDGVVPVIIDSKSPDVQNAILSAIDVADEAGSVQGGPPTAKQMLKWVSKWKLPGFDIAASSASPSLSPPPAAAAPEASADNKPPPTRDDMIGWVKKWSKLPSDFLSFAGVPGTAAPPTVTLLDPGVAAALSVPSLDEAPSSLTPHLSNMKLSSDSYFDKPPTTGSPGPGHAGPVKPPAPNPITGSATDAPTSPAPPANDINTLLSEATIIHKEFSDLNAFNTTVPKQLAAGESNARKRLRLLHASIKDKLVADYPDSIDDIKHEITELENINIKFPSDIRIKIGIQSDLQKRLKTLREALIVKLPDSNEQMILSEDSYPAHPAAAAMSARASSGSPKHWMGLGPNGEPAKGGGRASADAASHHVGGGRRVSSLRKRLHKS